MKGRKTNPLSCGCVGMGTPICEGQKTEGVRPFWLAQFNKVQVVLKFGL